MRKEFRLNDQTRRPPNIILVSSVVFTAESRGADAGGPLGKFPASIAKFRSLLAGSVVYVQSVSADNTPYRAKQQQIWIEAMGGTHTDQMSSAVTHMVTQFALDKEFADATRRNIPVVGLSWAATCFQHGACLNPSSYPHRAGCLSGVRVSCFGAVDIEALSTIIQNAGGQWEHFKWDFRTVRYLPTDLTILVVPDLTNLQPGGLGQIHHFQMLRHHDERARLWADKHNVAVQTTTELQDFIARHGVPSESADAAFFTAIKQADAAHAVERAACLAELRRDPASLASHIVQTSCPSSLLEWIRVVRVLMYTIMCAKIEMRRVTVSQDQLDVLAHSKSTVEALLDQEQSCYLAQLPETDSRPSDSELATRRQSVKKQWVDAVTKWVVKTKRLQRRSELSPEAVTSDAPSGEPLSPADSETSLVDAAAERLGVSSDDDDDIASVTSDRSGPESAEPASAQTGSDEPAPEGPPAIHSDPVSEAARTVMSELDGLFEAKDPVQLKQRLNDVAFIFHPLVWAMVDKALGDSSQPPIAPVFNVAIDSAVEKFRSAVTAQQLIEAEKLMEAGNFQSSLCGAALSTACFGIALQQLEQKASGVPDLQPRLEFLQNLVGLAASTAASTPPRSRSSTSSVATAQPSPLGAAAAGHQEDAVSARVQQQLLEPLRFVQWQQSNLVHPANDSYSAAFPGVLFGDTSGYCNDPTARAITLVWAYDEVAAEARNDDQNVPAHSKSMPLLPYFTMSATAVEPQPFASAALLADTFSADPIAKIASGLIAIKRDPLLGRVEPTSGMSLGQDPRFQRQDALLKEYADQSVQRCGPQHHLRMQLAHRYDRTLTSYFFVFLCLDVIKVCTRRVLPPATALVCTWRHSSGPKCIARTSSMRTLPPSLQCVTSTRPSRAA